MTITTQSRLEGASAMIEEHFPSVVTRPIHHFANLYGTTPFFPDNNWGTTTSNKHCTATSTGH